MFASVTPPLVILGIWLLLWFRPAEVAMPVDTPAGRSSGHVLRGVPGTGPGRFADGGHLVVVDRRREHELLARGEDVRVRRGGRGVAGREVDVQLLVRVVHDRAVRDVPYQVEQRDAEIG